MSGKVGDSGGRVDVLHGGREIGDEWDSGSVKRIRGIREYRLLQSV